MITKSFAYISIILLCSFAAAPNSWIINKEAKVNFRIKGMLGSNVKGTLNYGNHKIDFDEASISSSNFYIEIPVNSINTDNEKRDKHLLTSDFFDAKKYPLIKFASTSLENITNGTYVVNGNLTIKSITKSVQINFKFIKSGNKGSFNGSLKINRLDYGVGEKSMMIGDLVTIDLNVPVTDN